MEDSKVFFTCTFLTIIVSLTFVNCANTLKSPVSHYLELGCSPQPCPNNVQAYRCPFETLGNSTTNKCIYKGKLTGIGEQIPNSGCYFGCTCVEDRIGDKPGFICAMPGCYEPFTNASCIYQYTLGGCCSTGQICGDDKLKKLSKCVVGSATYLEGQRFYPAGTCKECVCGKGFLGKLDSPHCRVSDCAIERFSADMISARCAPIYAQESTCCPIGWECYKSTTQITKRKASTNANTKYQCTFGQMKLNVGDKIVSQDPCVTCSCDYPPLATCVRTKGCVSPPS